jgi:hypothetical protein
MTMRARIVSAVILALAAPTALSGPKLELGIGQTKFHAREDGTWFQSQYETHNDLTSASWRLALRDYFTGSRHFGWSLGYSYLGSFSGHNRASLWDDEAGRIPADGSACDFENKSHGCLGWFDGSGKAKGITLGLTADHTFKGLTLGVEGGVFVFRSSYNVNLHLDQGINFDDSRGKFLPGSTYEYNHATGTQGTWYVGYRASYGPVFAELLHFHNVFEQGRGPGGDVGLTGGKTVQVLIGVSINL